VAAVVPDARVSIEAFPSTSPNDPYFADNQRDLDVMRMALAWTRSTGSPSVKVAILDTGIMSSHPDLAGVELVSPRNELDDTATPSDGNGHGTHVAGTIAAQADNGIGVAGIAPDVAIMPVKVLDDDGTGYLSDFFDGVDWARMHGANVINASLGAHLDASVVDALQPTIDEAYAAGVTIVAAAGNDGTSSISYPAGFDHVIGVGATDNADEHAWFSQTNASVDVSAPGVDIASTFSDGGYQTLSGTSMASPHVAAVAALILSVASSLGPDDVASALSSTAVDLGSPGRDDVFGAGRIDAAGALDSVMTPEPTPTPSATTGSSPSPSPTVLPTAPPSRPGAPTAVSARAGVNQATVSWLAPASGGSSPITGYTATSAPGDKACTAGPAASSCTVSGLSNGVSYTFSVTASNAVGPSDPSEPSIAVTPRMDTAAPVIVASSITPDWVSSSAGGTVSIELRISDDLSGARSPTVTLERLGGGSSTGMIVMTRVTGDQYDGVYRGSYGFPSGAAGGEWRARVWGPDDVAGNSAGFNFVTGLVVGTPAAPSDLAATVGRSRTIQLSWTRPDDGGNAIEGYLIDQVGSTTEYTVSDTTATLSFPDWPASEPLSFTVRARNAIGQSRPSGPSAPLFVPAAPPDAPVLAGMSWAGRAVTASWFVPRENGAPITSYVVTSQPDGRNCVTTSTSCTLTDLSTGQWHTFTVTATNAGGASPPSDPSAPWFAEDVAPVMSSLSLGLASGERLAGTSVPIRVAWTGHDDGGSGLAAYMFGVSYDGKVWGGTSLPPTTTSTTFTVRNGLHVRYRVTAQDGSNNVSPPLATPSFYPWLVQQSDGDVVYSGAWTTSRSTSYSGGSVRYAKASGASLSYRFTGRAIALVTTTSPTRGKARIYVNGVYQATVDLRSSSSGYRVLAWQKTWSTSRTRTVKVVVLGTAGRPRVDADGFVVLK
jgi:hypothetical protein